MSVTLYQVQDGVAVITLSNPPVNALSWQLRQHIVAAVQAANLDASVQAIVLHGAGKSWCGGADIKEFSDFTNIKQPVFTPLMDSLEQSAKPVVAAVHGLALGGGLELALASHARVFAQGTNVAFPEVGLGILPGAGGTQRFPRVVGLEVAANLICSGKTVPIESLAALPEQKLVQQLSESAETVLADAVALAKSKVGQASSRTRDLPAKHPYADGFFTTARAAIQAKAKGLLAPQLCLEAVQAAFKLPFDAGIAKEQELFLTLMNSPQARAAQHVFMAQRAAGKVADVPADTPVREVKQVGVIGAGTMGGGITMNFLSAGIPVVLLEMKQEALDRGIVTIRKNYEAQVKKGRLTQDKVEAMMALIQPSLSYEDLGQADLIIEAVFEDMGVKEQVFSQLDAIAKPGAILASNTSTLDVDEIANITKRPEDVIGLHFFSPANVMKLLEVVRGAKTSKEVLATALGLAKKIKKLAIVSGVCDGFIGNRMLDPYIRQALFLVDEGATPAQVDKAMEKFGMNMGPFRMCDLVGNDVMGSIRQRQRALYPGKFYSPSADWINEQGRFGQKTGSGWYDYVPGARAPVPSKEVLAMIAEKRTELGLTPRKISEAEIVARCTYALVNEGAKILQEGIAERASDIDMVYLSGYGFPSFRGGPMQYADEVGAFNIVQAMAGFAANPHGDPAFWQAAPLLQDLAAQGGKFNA